MKHLKLFVFVIVVAIVCASHFAVTTFDPEVGTSIAVQQMQSDDAARETMRAYEAGKRSIFTMFDLAIPVAAVALFGGDFLAWTRREKSTLKGDKS